MGAKSGIPTRRASNRLTVLQVRNAGPGKHYDGGGSGLFLLVKPNGARSWVQRVTVAGKRREMGLGSPPVVTLADAREAALNNRRTIRGGADPIAARADAAKVPTFADASRTVHKLHEPTWRNAKHAQQFITTLETYAFPRIGRRKVSDVNTADVLAVLSPIWNEKRETARRVKQRIGMVLKWAVAKGWRQDDSTQAIAQALPKDRQVKAHRKSLPYAEAGACLRVIHATDAEVSTKLALELLILTASRSAEVRLARWGQVDWKAEGGPLWTRPASVMKAKRDHAVPLSRRAVQVLQEAAGISDHEHPDALIFPGAVRGKPLSDATMLKLLRENGYEIDVHGFRSTFKVWAQERTTFAREVSEAALAHTISNKVEAAYARSDLIEKRRALGEAWARFLAQDTAKIVRIG